MVLKVLATSLYRYYCTGPALRLSAPLGERAAATISFLHGGTQTFSINCKLGGWTGGVQPRISAAVASPLRHAHCSIGDLVVVKPEDPSCSMSTIGSPRIRRRQPKQTGEIRARWRWARSASVWDSRSWLRRVRERGLSRIKNQNQLFRLCGLRDIVTGTASSVQVAGSAPRKRESD